MSAPAAVPLKAFCARVGYPYETARKNPRSISGARRVGGRWFVALEKGLRQFGLEPERSAQP